MYFTFNLKDIRKNNGSTHPGVFLYKRIFGTKETPLSEGFRRIPCSEFLQTRKF